MTWYNKESLIFMHLRPINLSHREELHLQTLTAFVDLHEFSDLNLVQALRSDSPHLHACLTLITFQFQISHNKKCDTSEDGASFYTYKGYKSV